MIIARKIARCYYSGALAVLEMKRTFGLRALDGRRQSEATRGGMQKSG
jgi:hypothetical protein